MVIDSGPLKPRTESEVPPLPGAASVAKPAARVTAWVTLLSPRSVSCELPMASTLAGVSRLERPRRLPVVSGVARSGLPEAAFVADAAFTRTAGSVAFDDDGALASGDEAVSPSAKACAAWARQEQAKAPRTAKRRALESGVDTSILVRCGVVMRCV
ncbi:hypothetical protein PSP6_440010 [Paraburkholderia tropica]|nr:hypothetical protein PSP6_440010 [Paraburkholderia tropica]